LGTARAPVTTSTFRPVADSWVAQNRTNTNFGTANALKVDGSPVQRSYLRFDLQGLAGTIRKTLRLNSATASSVGYSVRAAADNSWGETTVTYANAPASSSTVTGTSGAFGSGQWVTVDVTSLVRGNGLVSVAPRAATRARGTGDNSRGSDQEAKRASATGAPATRDLDPSNSRLPELAPHARDDRLRCRPAERVECPGGRTDRIARERLKQAPLPHIGRPLQLPRIFAAEKFEAFKAMLSRERDHLVGQDYARAEAAKLDVETALNVIETASVLKREYKRDWTLIHTEKKESQNALFGSPTSYSLIEPVRVRVGDDGSSSFTFPAGRFDPKTILEVIKA
jgi:hypothetical protein